MNEEYLSFDNTLNFSINGISQMISVISVMVGNKHFRSYATEEKIIDSTSYKTLEELKADSDRKRIKKSFVEEIKRNWKEYKPPSE